MPEFWKHVEIVPANMLSDLTNGAAIFLDLLVTSFLTMLALGNDAQLDSDELKVYL